MNKYELFLGAYVMYANEIYTVSDIINDCCVLQKDLNTEVAYYKDLQPIELTKEWLKNFGFKADTKCQWYNMFFKVIMFKRTEIYYVFHAAKLELNSTKYVHDLQRAYQLATGKCLEKILGTN